MKRLKIIISLLTIVLSFAGCNTHIIYETNEINENTRIVEKYFKNINTDCIIKDRTSVMSKYDIKSDPTKAILFENNSITELSSLDKEVIVALNIFQTTLLLENFSISQGLVNPDYNNIKGKDRLEIYFGDNQGFDKIVIIDESYYIIYNDYEYTSLYGYDDDYGVYSIIPYGEVLSNKEYNSLNWMNVFKCILNS